MSDSTLIKAQKAVIWSIVPNKSTLPILGTVKRTGSTIEVTDLDTGARVHHLGATPNGFEPVLIAKRQALDTLDKPYTVGDGKVEIDGAALPVLKADDYPLLETPTSAIELSYITDWLEFRESLAYVAVAMSGDLTRIALCSVLLDQAVGGIYPSLIATGGHRLHTASLGGAI